jgi:glycosyltransferase involved in cell wall biosynthesis
MKVLLVTSMYPSAEKKYSGIFVKNQFELIGRMMETGETIEIFFMRRRITSTLGSITKHIRAFFRFLPYMFRSYDVIHLHSFFPLIFSVWLYKVFHPKSKMIVTFHGMDINLQVNNSNKGFLKLFARKIDFTIPVGQEVANNVTKKLGLPVGKVLPVGVSRQMFFQEAGVSKDYDFIFVGSFFEVKGIDLLYNAIKNLDRNIKFCVVGHGEKYEELFSQLIKDNYNIELKVDLSQNDLRSHYNRSKFLVLPSRSEGFATVIVESMFCGTPVVTSDIPQFKEQVIENVNGFCFPLNEPEKLEALLGNLRDISPSEYKRLSDNALSAFPNLSLDKVCEELLTIYRQ